MSWSIFGKDTTVKGSLNTDEAKTGGGRSPGIVVVALPVGPTLVWYAVEQ